MADLGRHRGPSLTSAVDAGYRFWAALAREDVSELEELLSPDARDWIHEHHGFIDYPRRLRKNLVGEATVASRLGLLPEAELLPDGRLRTRWTPTPIVVAGVPVVVWILELEEFEDRWVVNPLESSESVPGRRVVFAQDEAARESAARAGTLLS